MTIPLKFNKSSKTAAKVVNELIAARRRFPAAFNSSHEGIAVIQEEIDEMWDAIKDNDLAHAKEEAVQVAAMAMRFIEDL